MLKWNISILCVDPVDTQTEQKYEQLSLIQISFKNLTYEFLSHFCASSIVCHVLKVRPQKCVMFSKCVLNSVSCSQSASSIVCHVLKVLHQKSVLHVRPQCVSYMYVIAGLFHPCWCCIFASSFATNDDDKN